MNQNEMNAFKRAAVRAKGEPVSVKDKVVGMVVGLVFIALCAGIWLKPDLVSGNAVDISGPGGPVLAQIMDAAWSRPVAIISGIIGLFIGWGAITRKVG